MGISKMWLYGREACMQALNFNPVSILRAMWRKYQTPSPTAVAGIVYCKKQTVQEKKEMSQIPLDLCLHHCGLDWPGSEPFVVSVVMEFRSPSQRWSCWLTVIPDHRVMGSLQLSLRDFYKDATGVMCCDCACSKPCNWPALPYRELQC